jgi:hypothetical protein
MKKYSFGLIAVLASICFSAFKAPFAVHTYQLMSDPTTNGIVSDQGQWSSAGTNYGTCSSTPEDLACAIKIDNITMAKYFHVDGSGNRILNTRSYAYANTASDARFLHIIETYVGPRFKIYTIIPFKIVSGFDQFDPNPQIVNAPTLNTGVGDDVAFFNAQQ